jgi:IS605 OrfB family transposase
MKQVVQGKLLPDAEQASALLRTMEAFNAACNAGAEVAFRERSANKFRLQPLVYRDLRERFGLSAQMAVRCISEVCGAYKRDKRIRPHFRLRGAVPYDERILSYKAADRVSILTLGGRILVPIVFGAHCADRLGMRRGQADLVYRDSTFYLLQTIDVPTPSERAAEDWLGVDLGIINIATDSDGEVFSGAKIKGIRHRYQRVRQRLQKKRTRSAKRLLAKRRHREARFARDVNHCVSKRIVAKAKGTGRGVAMENLKGIRTRITARKAHRRQLSSWSFGQLQAFIGYKAALAGVPVALVNPRHTSQTCPSCGLVDRRNRPSQSVFQCVACGFGGLADHIAALNIRSRGAVMRPHATPAVAG